MTNEQWEAILHNDVSYDGSFYYAVKTTGIFCRPSCKSRPPKRENITTFNTADEALAAHFRPCKRCRPTGARLPDEEWISIVTQYIDRNYMNDLSLSHLANISHGSPYHLHRTFRRTTGVTPVEYIQEKRIALAKQLLISSRLSIAEIGKQVGLRNTPYFITLFKKLTGITPAHYRQAKSECSKEVYHDEQS
ncbi:Bifunctional transcriptional activator/DNA repair enzyme AdaA [compost metagenome]